MSLVVKSNKPVYQLSSPYEWACNNTENNVIYYLGRPSPDPDSVTEGKQPYSFSIEKMFASETFKSIDDLRGYFDELETFDIYADMLSNVHNFIKFQGHIAKKSRRGFANVLLKPRINITLGIPENVSVYTVNEMIRSDELIFMYSGNAMIDKNLFITEAKTPNQPVRFDMHPEYKDRCIKIKIRY